MSALNLENFINAIKAVRQSYTCGVCSQLCKEPVTLSKCFHIICADHFEGLKKCPDCNTSLEGCTTYIDERLGSCINAVGELDKMFESYKNKDATTKKIEKKNNSPVEVTEPDVVNVTETEVVNVTENEVVNITEPKGSSTSVVTKPVLSDKANKSKKKFNKSNANSSMLSSGSKINKGIEKKNTKGETLLHTACRMGKVDKISELLIQGANTNTKDNAGWTPLHEVVQNGRLDLVKLLLQYNTLINVPGQSNETPLHEAIRYCHPDIVEELVKNGADMNARNCKGETPFQLASSEMKNILLAASDNIVQTQSVNISHMSMLHSELDFDNIQVYCVSQFRTVHNKLKSLARSHSNLQIESKFTKKVTHIIVDTDDNGVCDSSLDVLQGVMCSLWILTSQWVTKSSDKKLEQFDAYEVKGIGSKGYQGPRNARFNKYKQLPGIFNGCHFYLHNIGTKFEITKTIVVTKSILTKLITDAGGVVLRRVPNPELIPEQEKLVPYHAKKGGKLMNCSHYIIFKDMYQPMYNMQHLKALCIGWLIECMEKYELCEPW